MNKDKRIEIGRRLQKAREHRGLSQEELSQIMKEYGLEAIRRFEAGKRELDVNAFAAFCSALKTDMEWLLSGNSSKKQDGVESCFATYDGHDDSEPVGR